MCLAPVNNFSSLLHISQSSSAFPPVIYAEATNTISIDGRKSFDGIY